MKIECLLRQTNGSLITMGGERYDFQPNENGDHVCIVTNREHSARFIAIPEAYRVYGKVAAAQFAAAAAREHADSLKESAALALKEAKEAETIANKAVADADAEEKRMNDEAALEEERENEKVERVAKAKQRLLDERAGKLRDQEILRIMKENPDYNEDDAKKQYRKEQAEQKALDKKAA